MPKTDSQKEYKKKVKRLTVDFYPTETSLWNHIEAQPQKQTYIKSLIRADLEKQSNLRICPTCKSEWHNRETVCPHCGAKIASKPGP